MLLDNAVTAKEQIERCDRLCNAMTDKHGEWAKQKKVDIPRCNCLTGAEVLVTRLRVACTELKESRAETARAKKRTAAVKRQLGAELGFVEQLWVLWVMEWLQ